MSDYCCYYYYIIIIVIIVIINSSSKCWFDTIMCQVLPETSGRWRVACLTTSWIPPGNYINRDSSVFTYIQSTFHNFWAVFVSTIFCIFCSSGLPEI